MDSSKFRYHKQKEARQGPPGARVVSYRESWTRVSVWNYVALPKVDLLSLLYSLVKL